MKIEMSLLQLNQALLSWRNIVRSKSKKTKAKQNRHLHYFFLWGI